MKSKIIKYVDLPVFTQGTLIEFTHVNATHVAVVIHYSNDTQYGECVVLQTNGIQTAARMRVMKFTLLMNPVPYAGAITIKGGITTDVGSLVSYGKNEAFLVTGTGEGHRDSPDWLSGVCVWRNDESVNALGETKTYVAADCFVAFPHTIQLSN